MTNQIHNLNGRLRIKSSKLEDTDFAEKLLFNAFKCKAIENIQLNAKGNSIVVNYNPDLIDIDSIYKILDLDTPVLKRQSIKPATKIQKIDTNTIAQSSTKAEAVKKESTKTDANMAYKMAKVFSDAWTKAVLKETLGMFFGSSVPQNSIVNRGGKKFIGKIF